MLAKKFCMMIVLMIPFFSLSTVREFDVESVKKKMLERAEALKDTTKVGSSASKKNSDGCISITAVPFPITQSGSYCLENDVTLAAGQPVAISIQASHVTLDLQGHTITIPDGDVSAIFAANVTDIIIKNGKITTPAISQITGNDGIELLNVNRVLICNIDFSKTNAGIVMTGSSDIDIEKCSFTDITGGTTGSGVSIFATTSHDITINRCHFSGTTGSTTASSTSIAAVIAANVKVSNSKFLNVDVAVVFLHDATLTSRIGLFMEDDRIRSSSTNTQGIILLVSAFNSTIKKTSISRDGVNPGPGGIFALGVTNLLIDHVCVDTQFVSGPIDLFTGGIHFVSSKNVFVRDTVVTNTNDNGIVDEFSTNIIIDKVKINDSFVAGIHFRGTSLSVVVNSCISHNRGDGLLLENGASNNFIIHNEVKDNGGHGITLDATTSGNVVANNVFRANRTLPQINNAGTNVIGPNLVQ